MSQITEIKKLESWNFKTLKKSFSLTVLCLSLFLSPTSSFAQTIDDKLAELSIILSSQSQDADAFAIQMQEAYQQIFSFRLTDYSVLEIVGKGHIYRKKLTSLLRNLQDNLPQAYHLGLISPDHPESLAAIHGILRALRYADEMIGETMLYHNHLTQDKIPFTENGYIPRDGDLLLVRGMAANSAAISRVSSNPQQWSHIGIFSNGFLVEALIEHGLIATPWAKALKKGGLGRAAIFRPIQTDLQAGMAKGAQHLLARATNEKVEYNFSMSLLDGKRPDGTFDRLFCSLAIAEAAFVGCGLAVPMALSSIDFKNRSFLDLIGVTAGVHPEVTSFLPGDIQLDPRFELVYEWKDLSQTNRLRRHDLIIDAIYKLINDYGFNFRPSVFVQLASRGVKLASRINMINQLIESKVGAPIPAYMKSDVIAAMMMLDQTVKQIDEELEARDTMHFAYHGTPLHPADVQLAIEALVRKSAGELKYLRQTQSDSSPCEIVLTTLPQLVTNNSTPQPSGEGASFLLE